MGTYWLVLLCLFSVFLCALKGFIFFGSFRHIFYLSFSVFRVRGSLFFACELELSFFIIYLTLPGTDCWSFPACISEAALVIASRGLDKEPATRIPNKVKVNASKVPVIHNLFLSS